MVCQIKPLEKLIFIICLCCYFFLPEYCTEWPKDLKEDSLMEMSHFDYLRDGPSVKDERARFVSVTVGELKMFFFVCQTVKLKNIYILVELVKV